MPEFLDFELELHHLIFIFMIAITWTGMALWGRSELIGLYDTLPTEINVFINVSFWIGGGIAALGIGLIIYTNLE